MSLRPHTSPRRTVIPGTRKTAQLRITLIQSRRRDTRQMCDRRRRDLRVVRKAGARVWRRVTKAACIGTQTLGIAGTGSLDANTSRGFAGGAWRTGTIVPHSGASEVTEGCKVCCFAWCGVTTLTRCQEYWGRSGCSGRCASAWRRTPPKVTAEIAETLVATWASAEDAVTVGCDNRRKTCRRRRNARNTGRGYRR
jgi:hypothetical protein